MQIKEGVVVSLSKQIKKKTKAIAGKRNANLQSYFWCVWSAPLCILYSEVFCKICPHSWDILVLPTNMHDMWP